MSTDGKAVGCIAYCHHRNQCCEKLIEAIIETAQGDGYKEMVLDTIKPLKRAISLYKKYVFKKIEPHYDNPTDDVIYMKLVF